MHIKTKEKEQGRMGKFFKSHKKVAYTSLLTLIVIALGFGIFSVVRAVTPVNSTVTIASNRSYRGYSYNGNYPIYYGVNDHATFKPWSTYWYGIDTDGNGTVDHDAMCLQASKNEPNGSGPALLYSNTLETRMKRVMLATVPSYSAASVANGGPDYYTLFKNYYDWNTATASIKNLRTRDTNIRYDSDDSRAQLNSNGEEIVKYTDYYYGCRHYYDSACNTSLSSSIVNMSDAIFAMGHMMASGIYGNDYYAINNSQVNNVSTVTGTADSIEAWFNANYPNAHEDYKVYVSYLADSTKQTVGWLEYDPVNIEAYIKIKKVDADTNATTNGSLTVVGTKFGVYNSSNVQVDTITIGNDGTGTSSALGAGTYTVKETQATTGYGLNGATITVTINSGDNGRTIDLTGTSTACANGNSFSYGSGGCWFKNTPTKKARIKIKKLNSENQTVSYAGLTVAGTVFSVKNSSGTEVTTITIGNDGTGTSGPLDAGTYTITEKTATTGYKTNGAVLTVTIRNSDLGVNNPILDYSTSTTACTTSSTAPCTFFNDLIKGKISLTKTGYELSASGTAGKRNLAGIYFEATNQSDTSIKYTIGGTASDGTLTTQDMVYGTYKAKELRRAGSNNNAYKLLEFTFTITSSTTSTNTATISIVSGTGTLDGGTLRDDIPDNPNLHTVARNTSSTAASPSKDIEISDSAGVTDRITCSGLEANAEYKFDGTLWDKAASTQVKISSSNTNNVTGTVTFTADSNGKCNGNTGIDMDFARFDSSAYMGKTLAIKQVLFKNNGTTASPDWVRIAIHNSDLTDTDEEVKVSTIQITSSATTGRSNNKELTAGSVKIIDAVTIRGLTNGVSYKIIAQVKDASNNLVTIKDANGHTGTSITENYTMAAATGTSITVTMDIYLDSTPYVGQNLSVYLTLQLANGTTIATHNPPANGSETVSVVTPTIGTTAVNAHNTSSKEIEVGTIDATNGSPTIQDTIAYTGLTVGNVYTLVGEVWKLDANGNAVTKVATNGPTGHSFTASTENGTETVTFPVDTVTNCATNNRLSMPCKFVVYEYIYYGSSNTPFASHAVATDTAQIISVKQPEVKTKAADNADGDNLVEVDDGIKIKDTVTYSGLVDGQSYSLVMKVVKRSDPATVIATGSATFRADSTHQTTVTSAAFDSTELHDANLVGIDLVVYEYLYSGSTLIASHENPNDTDQIITVKTPTIKTTAYDAQNRTRELPVGTTTIIDEVEYHDLVPGKTYTVTGKLMRKDNGQPVKDTNGNDVVGSTTFTPTAATGTVDIVFTCNSTIHCFDTTLEFNYDSQTQPFYVAYEYLYKTNILIAQHEDINDNDQSITIGRPKIKTSATYKPDGSHLLGVGDVTMKDYVDYEGLVEGEWYMIVGTMVDPETGSPVEIGDEFVRNTKTFKAGANGKGTVELEINLNTIPIQGRKFVVYERLYRSNDKHGDGRLLAVHEPAVDEDDQTISVKIATIGTTASDKADGDNVLNHEAGQVIRDKVHYDGLLMGEDYILYGYLYDKTNHAPLKDADGNLITATATFTTPARVDNGDITMDFNVDASNLPGVEIVVFEYLFAGSTVPTNPDGSVDFSQVVTKHADEENPDPAQTVKVSMRIGTTAADAYDGDQVVGVGKVKVIDTLKYEGVIMGKTYKAKGWLVYKTDGNGHHAGDKVQAVSFNYTVGPCVIPDDEDESSDEDNNNNNTNDCSDPEAPTYVAVEGSATFTVGETGYEETTGTVSITFEFDSRNLIGEHLVVFEELYVINEDETEELVAEHKDLTDDDQAITVATPTIHTVAVDKLDNDKELANDTEVIILDKVEYTGLAAGTTYTLYGVLVDKNTGERISGGITEVTHIFTPTRDSGSEEIQFTINTTGMSGKEIVVFETLYIDAQVIEDNKIAEHKDLNDDSQTVWVKVNGPNTGLFTHPLEEARRNGLYATLGGMVILVTGGWFASRYTKHRKIRKF